MLFYPFMPFINEYKLYQSIGRKSLCSESKFKVETTTFIVSHTVCTVLFPTTLVLKVFHGGTGIQ